MALFHFGCENRLQSLPSFELSPVTNRGDIPRHYQ